MPALFVVKDFRSSTWQCRKGICKIEMAHGVLSKDMVNLVQAMKQAQRFAQTTLDVATVRARMLSGLGPEDPLPQGAVESHKTDTAIAQECHISQPVESSYYNVQTEFVNTDNMEVSKQASGPGTFVT
ncbi:focal adhesion kinase 1 [Caerostris extrusa]|uniref:Focal adhesion kinase 1 n=1 Tax=Caerostris extrusa TaxID=172846 RepID=A0AAV4TZT8_CAEEX|nr:focal adhesion kinase 1 [Caerostris extrusa]